MNRKTLGNSDLHITPLGFGSWAIGGPKWEYGWGPQDDQDSVEAIRACLDAGVNWIDTAAAYGLGHSEEIVARALEGLSDKPYIFTKCSLIGDHEGKISNSLKADSLRRELEGSLRRLRVETIDLYQIHWPNPEPDLEEGWEALLRFQKQGKVRYIGVSNFNVEQMRRVEKLGPIVSLQPPYSLVERDIEEEILPYALRQHIGVIVYSPMQTGLLTGKMTLERVANLPADDWRRRSSHFQEPGLSRNLRLVERLREIGLAHGKAPGEVAVAWTLRHPAVTGAIVGFRSAAQVKDLIGALDFRLSPEDIAAIESFNSA